MITKEDIKKYFWALLGAIGMIFFWAGVWDGIGTLPFIENIWISLIVGLAILTFSGTIYKEFDPLKEMEEAVHLQLHKVHSHPQKKEFHIKYYDRIKKKHLLLRGDSIRRIEKGFIVFHDERGEENFIPGHRVSEILHKGKSYWKS